jgi:hypothetical protein
MKNNANWSDSGSSGRVRQAMVSDIATKKHVPLLIGILACLLIAAGAYLWTSRLMDSVYAYRSLLQDTPPAPGEPLGAPLTRRVVFVLIDALREDTSLKPDVMPFLNELRGRSATATIHSRPPSYSQPGYSTLLTGAWPDLSDSPTINLDYEKIPTWTQDDLFSAVQRAGRKAAVSGFNWFERLIPQGAVAASFYTPGEDAAADRAVVDAALPWLKANDHLFTMIHIDQVDYAGHHEGGPVDPRWDAAARRADGLLAEIAATLDLSKDTLFVASDHGQIDRGGHGGQDPVTLVEPWVLAGAGVKPGNYGDVAQVDVTPTLAALLGVNIPASAQGRARTEMLTLTPKQIAAIERAATVQQAALAQNYAQAIGRPVRVEPGGEVVAVTQAAMDAARAARLRTERLPRILLALVLAVAPAVLLFLRRGRTVAWLLAGAVLAVALFHLRYAVLAGRTYSLSSVTSSDDLIAFVAVTGLLTFAVSWVVTAFPLRTFQARPGRAASLTIALTLVTVYLLSLPILWSYAFNGLFVTWALPEFGSLFLGMISGVQALAVAAGGLILCGVAALIAWLVSRKGAQKIQQP